MTTFDNREAAFENKFARDEEFQFKVTARRNKLVGLWAGVEADETAIRAALDTKMVEARRQFIEEV